MAEKVASLYAEISADTSKLQKGLGTAQSELKKTATSTDLLKKGLKSLGTTAALGAIISTIRSMTQEAMEAERVMAATEATIKATGGAAGLTAQQISDLAEAESRLSSIDDEVVQTGMNMLLTFKQIGSDTMPRATRAMADMAVAMAKGDTSAVDLQGTAIQLGKALNDPILGVTALRRVGVMLSEQQQQQIRDFMAVNDVASAQAIILDELESEFGGMAEAMGNTTAGKIQKAKNSLNNLKEEIATALLPILGDAADGFTLLANKGRMLNDVYSKHKQEIIYTSDSYEDYLTELERSLNLIGESYEATLLYNDGITEMGSREEWLTDTKGALTEAVWEYVRATENGKLEKIDMNEQLYNAVAASEETKDGLFDLEEQAGILAGSMDELTSRTLFNAAAADLDAAAQIELAREMGLLNDESYAALTQVQYWNQQLADGKITVDEYTEKVAGLNEELRLMENPPPVIIDVEIDDEAWRNFKYEVTHFKGLIPVGAGGGGGYIPQAEGGDWIVRKPTLFLAGEAGTERATFTPLDGSRGNISRNMTVNFYGNYGSASEIAQRLAMMEAYGV
jgi:hypothetical protein